MSGAEFVSPATRFVAADSKATNRPSALIAGRLLGRSDCTDEGPTLTRVVAPIVRSRTKTSERWLVSPGIRLVASDPKATNRPSAEIAGLALVGGDPAR